MTLGATHIIWFKRDLRVKDHGALVKGAAAGPIVPLYVIEEDYWAGPDTSRRQYEFLCESLHDLKGQLAAFSIPLQVERGSVIDVLNRLKRQFGHIRLYSHEETGNAWTYQRDMAVKKWCRREAIDWFEQPQHGVVRRLHNRDGWASNWDQMMSQPMVPVPEMIAAKGLQETAIPSADDLGLLPDPCPNRQMGGTKEGEALLESFLSSRGETYRASMANPIDGEWACSRVSAHLSLGCLSIRQVSQACIEAIQEAKRSAPKRSMWPGSLQSFYARLHWHCHFIQKLEDEPALEFQNLHPAYNGLRPETADIVRLDAWAEGYSGLPFLDACMRFLKATGWLNFRMRAMVMAVASYHLWLPWRATGLVLARRFTDYEPGIHWSQVQMQSGTTGINTPRIYNPVKQGLDQDPDGIFTRKWVPELADIPDEFLQSPWRWNGAATILGKTYPHPIIEPIQAAREAREKIWAIRRGSEFRSTAQRIVQKHGSRKNNDRDGRPSRRRSSAKKPKNQLSLFE